MNKIVIFSRFRNQILKTSRQILQCPQILHNFQTVSNFLISVTQKRSSRDFHIVQKPFKMATSKPDLARAGTMEVTAKVCLFIFQEFVQTSN